MGIKGKVYREVTPEEFEKIVGENYQHGGKLRIKFRIEGTADSGTFAFNATQFFDYDGGEIFYKYPSKEFRAGSEDSEIRSLISSTVTDMLSKYSNVEIASEIYRKQ